MRIRSILTGIALLALAPAAGATEKDALTFIRGMLGGIDAAEIECPAPVREAARVRDMSAVCARFEGRFDLFRTAWEARHASGFAPRSKGGTTLGRPRTGWESNAGTRERIYSVGHTVVGVRFRDGEVLLVYK